MANAVGWLILVGGIVVGVEALKHLSGVRAASANSDASNSTTSPNVSAPGVTNVAPGSNESAGSPMPGGSINPTNIPTNSVNVGGGAIPGLQLGTWPNEAQMWAQNHAGQISQNGSPAGLAAAIDALVIGESNGFPDALGDNGTSHGLLQLHEPQQGANDPTIYRSLTNSLNLAWEGGRILSTYNRYVDMGIDPTSTPDNFAHFWADAQVAQYAPGNGSQGTSGLASGVLSTLHQLLPSLHWQNQPGNNPQYLFQ